MRFRHTLRGLTGLLALLGFVGVFTENRAFLPFFAFAVDFEYFFIQSDEMLDDYLNKAASLAFHCGMFATAIVTVGAILLGGRDSRSALLTGFAAGWGVSVAVHGLSVGYYAFRESWVAGRDEV